MTDVNKEVKVDENTTQVETEVKEEVTTENVVQEVGEPLVQEPKVELTLKPEVETREDGTTVTKIETVVVPETEAKNYDYVSKSEFVEKLKEELPKEDEVVQEVGNTVVQEAVDLGVGASGSYSASSSSADHSTSESSTVTNQDSIIGNHDILTESKNSGTSELNGGESVDESIGQLVPTESNEALCEVAVDTECDFEEDVNDMIEKSFNFSDEELEKILKSPDVKNSPIINLTVAGLREILETYKEITDKEDVSDVFSTLSLDLQETLRLSAAKNRVDIRDNKMVNFFAEYFIRELASNIILTKSGEELQKKITETLSTIDGKNFGELYIEENYKQMVARLTKVIEETDNEDLKEYSQAMVDAINNSTTFENVKEWLLAKPKYANANYARKRFERNLKDLNTQLFSIGIKKAKFDIVVAAITTKLDGTIYDAAILTRILVTELNPHNRDDMAFLYYMIINMTGAIATSEERRGEFSNTIINNLKGLLKVISEEADKYMYSKSLEQSKVRKTPKKRK